MTRIGIVGIGEMGGAFVERLLGAKRTVTGWNRTRAKAAHLIDAGMLWADSPAAVAAASDVVLTMVTDAAALEAITSGSDGLLGAIAGKVWVELSTCAADDAVALAARVRAHGGELVDGAVLGSPLTIRQGRLVIMVSGDAAPIATAQPVLAELGPRVVTMGETGKAKVMKIALNLNLAAQILALSEGCCWR